MPGASASRDAGAAPAHHICRPDAGSAPSVFEQIHYFLGYEAEGEPLPCGIYTLTYAGPVDRTSTENARVLVEQSGSVLFSVSYDWRNAVPFADAPPYRMDFDGHFALLIQNADFPGVTDLWNLQANFDGKHVLVVN